MAYSSDEVWARYYDGVNQGLTGDVAFYVELAREATGPIVELACGTGRVLFPLAASTPQRVTGLDLSEPMLAVCRARLAQQPPDVRERITLVHGDMRDFRLPEPAALIVIPYRAFHHLLTVDDQKACLRAIRRALAPDGLVCINCFDPRLSLVASEGEYLGRQPLPRVDFVHEPTGHAVHVATAWRAWQPEEQTFRELWTFTEFDGDRVVGEYEAHLALRYGFRWELEHLFRLEGFRVAALFGDFTGAPFRYGAEQIWLLRAAAA